MKTLILLLISLSSYAQTEIGVGVEYKEYLDFPFQGQTQYLNNDKGFTYGDVIYYDHPYKHVYLKYDLVTDKLVTVHQNGYQQMELNKDGVKSFKVDSISFINIKEKYYRRLNDSIYVRLIKTISPRSFVEGYGGVWDVISEKKPEYYKMTNNGLRQIKGRKETKIYRENNLPIR